jgi:hypothetical protein
VLQNCFQNLPLTVRLKFNAHEESFRFDISFLGKSRQEFQTLGGVAVLKGYQARDKGLKDAIALAVNNMSVPRM